MSNELTPTQYFNVDEPSGLELDLTERIFEHGYHGECPGSGLTAKPIAEYAPGTRRNRRSPPPQEK